MSTLLAGTASTVITPPVGTWLEGYGGRTSGSTGVHDDLHARALVVDDGATRAAVVACDLIGIDRHTTAAVRAIVEAATDIPAAHVMVAATHTHAGPVGMHRHDDAPLRDVQDRLIAGAVIAAWRARRPAVLKAGAGAVDSVSRNRRDPAGPVDDALRVLLLDDPEAGRGPVASLVNFGCHPTVLYSTNLEISADYPGRAVATAAAITGGPPPLFLNGACGDVNPAWIAQEHEEAARVGAIVGAEAARRLQELRPLGHGLHSWNIRWDEVLDVPVRSGEIVEPRLRVAARTVGVRLRALPDAAAYDAPIGALEARASASASVEERRGLIAELTRLRGERATAGQLRGPNRIRAEVQAIGLGPSCAILALPGEFFVETARAIREASGVRHLFVACYANHHLMYIVPRNEFSRGGYEPGVAILDEDAEEAFRAAAVDVLREVTGA